MPPPQTAAPGARAGIDKRAGRAVFSVADGSRAYLAQRCPRAGAAADWPAAAAPVGEPHDTTLTLCGRFRVRKSSTPPGPGPALRTPTIRRRGPLDPTAGRSHRPRRLPARPFPAFAFSFPLSAFSPLPPFILHPFHLSAFSFPLSAFLRFRLSSFSL